MDVNRNLLMEVVGMQKNINNIINKNKKIFGEILQIEKINVGFTNTILKINNKYILKICTDINNEEKFKNEINFYNSNRDNQMIPKLYGFDIEKNDVEYMYEILENIEGINLYNVWHTFDEYQRENIIKQICDAMKQIHTNTGDICDWCKYISESFEYLYKEANNLKLFNSAEQEYLIKGYSKFNHFLNTEETVLVHNDLHFDNIIYKDGKIRIIDFERLMYAPKDFELDILYRMIRKPWKYASEDAENYIKLDDYKNIMSYIEKYYPELISVNNLYKRLAIYDVVYYLKQYIKNPSILELKEDVLEATKIVITDKK